MRIKFIKPFQIFQFIPQKYKKYGSINPYLLPIFGNMFFGRIKKILKIIKLNVSNFDKCLEVGAGFGLVSINFKINFPNSQFYLLDISSNEILTIIKNIIEKKLNLKFKYNFECDIQKKTPYNDKCFDLILAIDVLEHVNDPSKALDEILRILKEGGFLFISVPVESIILIFFRRIFNFISPICTNPHWNGEIKSEREFYNCLVTKKIKVILKRKYPFKFLPKLFAYDIFYLVQKL